MPFENDNLLRTRLPAMIPEALKNFLRVGCFLSVMTVALNSILSSPHPLISVFFYGFIASLHSVVSSCFW